MCNLCLINLFHKKNIVFNKKYTIYKLIFLLISCSKEELQIENTDFVASDMLSNKEIKENPSILNSVKFKKINAINKETNKKGIFYFKKIK